MAENAAQFLDDEEQQTAGSETAAELEKHVSLHSSGFCDFSLKPELLKAIIDCGFEHPLEVQKECMPQLILGKNILCQAKSGMGKKTVIVLATLQQLDPVDNQVSVLVLCHTRNLALEISKEFERFSKYMPSIKIGVFVGGVAVPNDEKVLSSNCPHIVVGTPGRILHLVRKKKLDLQYIKHFVLDECDKMLTANAKKMRYDILEISISFPGEKQVMMFSSMIMEDFCAACEIFFLKDEFLHVKLY